MSLAILFHFLCAQHVSDINISIFRSLRLCCWITTSVVLFSVRCVLELLVWLVLSGDRIAGWSTSCVSSHLQVWWYQRLYNIIRPPDDEHMCSKHVEAWNTLIIKFSASSWLILINKSRYTSWLKYSFWCRYSRNNNSSKTCYNFKSQRPETCWFSYFFVTKEQRNKYV